MEVSNTAMNMASMTASAMSQGFTVGLSCVTCVGVMAFYRMDESRVDGLKMLGVQVRLKNSEEGIVANYRKAME